MDIDVVNKLTTVEACWKAADAAAARGEFELAAAANLRALDLGYAAGLPPLEEGALGLLGTGVQALEFLRESLRHRKWNLAGGALRRCLRLFAPTDYSLLDVEAAARDHLLARQLQEVARSQASTSPAPQFHLPSGRDLLLAIARHVQSMSADDDWATWQEINATELSAEWVVVKHSSYFGSSVLNEAIRRCKARGLVLPEMTSRAGPHELASQDFKSAGLRQLLARAMQEKIWSTPRGQAPAAWARTWLRPRDAGFDEFSERGALSVAEVLRLARSRSMCESYAVVLAWLDHPECNEQADFFVQNPADLKGRCVFATQDAQTPAVAFDMLVAPLAFDRPGLHPIAASWLLAFSRRWGERCYGISIRSCRESSNCLLELSRPASEIAESLSDPYSKRSIPRDGEEYGAYCDSMRQLLQALNSIAIEPASCSDCYPTVGAVELPLLLP